MAMGGLRPVVAIYSSFLTRALDQVNLDVGLHHLPVVVCVDRAGITGPDGPSHHGVLDLALLGRVPGMTVFAPSSAAELEAMLVEALAASGPCALRWPSGTAREAPAGDVGRGRRARRLRTGRDICIAAVGPLVEAAEEAAGMLEGVGVSATVWDMRLAKPLDGDLVADAGRHRLVVTVEDGVREGGAGARLVDALGRSAVGHGGLHGPDGTSPVIVLGVPDAYVVHGDPTTIRAELGLDGIGIAAAARDGLRRIHDGVGFGGLTGASAML
jgi:1-deoxy-D-xylulose-5-phosphate synthase